MCILTHYHFSCSVPNCFWNSVCSCPVCWRRCGCGSVSLAVWMRAWGPEFVSEASFQQQDCRPLTALMCAAFLHLCSHVWLTRGPADSHLTSVPPTHLSFNGFSFIYFWIDKIYISLECAVIFNRCTCCRMAEAKLPNGTLNSVPWFVVVEGSGKVVSRGLTLPLSLHFGDSGTWRGKFLFLGEVGSAFFLACVLVISRKCPFVF